jgi:hypothetical protein
MLSEFDLFTKYNIDELYHILGLKIDNDIHEQTIIEKIISFKHLPFDSKPYFTNYIEPKTYDKSNNITFLKLADNISDYELGAIHESILNTYRNGGTDAKLVEDLMLYSYIAEGFSNRYTNIRRIFPQELLSEIGLTSTINNSDSYVSDNLKAVKNGTKTYNYDDFIVRFLLNNIHNNRFIPVAKNSNTPYGNGINFSAFMSDSANDTFSVPTKDVQKYNTEILDKRFIKHTFKQGTGKNISYKTVVFQKIGATPETITFKRIDTSKYNTFMNTPANVTYNVSKVDIDIIKGKTIKKNC